MKYCNNTTSNHPIVISHKDCLCDINSLIFSEGFVGNNTLFTNQEVVINLDKVEDIISKIEKRKEKNMSMDMAFGITNPDLAKKQILMVELKFNVTDFYYLKKTDLEKKVASSSAVLSEDIPITKLFVFIFRTENLHEGVSRLCRMVPKIASNYVAMDIHNLKKVYFD